MKVLFINSKKNGTHAVYYDDEDHGIISAKTWSLWKSPLGKTAKFYAVTTNSTKGGEKQRPIKMHRMLMHAKDGVQIDHIDGNGLNNQKSNLRFATIAQNHQNKHSWKLSKAGYRGVVKQVQTKSKYMARISVNRKIIMVCGFSSPEDAAREYNNLAKKYHGEFAILNNI